MKTLLLLISKSFSTNIKVFIYWKIQNTAPILSWLQNPIFRPCKYDSYVKFCELPYLINIICVQHHFPFTPSLHTFIGQKNPIITLSPQFMPLHLAKKGQNRWWTQLGIGILLSQGGIGSISSLLHTPGPTIAHHIPKITTPTTTQVLLHKDREQQCTTLGLLCARIWQLCVAIRCAIIAELQW
jgi:hypothetical protein